MNVHEFENLGADLLVFLKFDFAKDLDIFTAPVKLCLVMHSFGFTNFVLHRPDNILCDLAHVHGRVQIRLLSLPPLSDESIEVCFAVNVGQGVTRQSLGL